MNTTQSTTPSAHPALEPPPQNTETPGLLSRRGALIAGAVLAVGAVGVDLFGTPSLAIAGAWGGYKNGEIPASALAAIPWTPSRTLRTDARDAVVTLNKAFLAKFGTNLAVNEGYRNLENQKKEKDYWTGQGHPEYAATPGTSNHGWALAMDIGVGRTDWNNPVYLWMKSNAPQHGWTHPAGAEPGGSYPEAWHWEFTGSDAAQPETKPQPETNPSTGNEEDDMANVITVSVPNGSGQSWWSLNMGDNTKARIINGTQLDFRRNIGIPEYTNQAPDVIAGFRDIS